MTDLDMENIIRKIDAELWKTIVASPFGRIDYDRLLAHDPTRIRREEQVLSLEEGIPDIPSKLELENIQIPSSDKGRDIRLRIYKPKGKGLLPILLYFHGGAFIYGTPEQYDSIFFRLAIDTEMLIVSVDYRLAPEHPFPAGMEDGYDALQWLAIYADQIGGDKANILIGGSSAGATVAASITHLARDQNFVKIRHQYLLYPPMSHRLQTASMQDLAHAPMQTKAAATWMWKHYLQDAIHPPPYAVPLLEANFKNLPDATIIVCELDPLKDEGIMYGQQLKDAGAFVHVLEIQGAVHAFDFFACALTDTFYKQQVDIFKQILKSRRSAAVSPTSAIIKKQLN